MIIFSFFSFEYFSFLLFLEMDSLQLQTFWLKIINLLRALIN